MRLEKSDSNCAKAGNMQREPRRHSNKSSKFKQAATQSGAEGPDENRSCQQSQRCDLQVVCTHD
eukprot:2200959-Amphidinium_carterae.1